MARIAEAKGIELSAGLLSLALSMDCSVRFGLSSVFECVASLARPAYGTGRSFSRASSHDFVVPVVENHVIGLPSLSAYVAVLRSALDDSYLIGVAPSVSLSFLPSRKGENFDLILLFLAVSLKFITTVFIDKFFRLIIHVLIQFCWHLACIFKLLLMAFVIPSRKSCMLETADAL